MAKSDSIAQLLFKRIQHGDYIQRDLPTEVALAEETGASRPTARKALRILMEQGLIVRGANGRLQMARDISRRRLQVCLLGPAFFSGNSARARITLDHLARRHNATVRSVEFVHWDDACIQDVLNSFDGVILMGSTEEMPADLPERIRTGRAMAVVLFGDLSAHGIPSIDLTPVAAFQKIFDHLADLGHRSIDCLNVQPVDVHIRRRFEQWRLWCQARRIEGEVFNQPVDHYQDPLRGAYLYAKLLLRQHDWRGRAVWCTTTPAATGLIRAAFEAGLRVGTDLAVAGADDDEGRAWAATPSVTTVQPADPAPYLELALEWMAGGGGKPWLGPLLATPADVPLFLGESSRGNVP